MRSPFQWEDKSGRGMPRPYVKQRDALSVKEDDMQTTNLLRITRIAALALSLALTSCVTHETTKPVAPTAGAATYPKDLHGARLFRVSSADSSVHILVYRGGTLASLGHNHVMSSTAITGYVWLGEPLTSSGFDIVVPANDLVIDDNGARAAEGDDFPLNISDSAREGTKRHMLEDVQLDGEHYPFITLKAVTIVGTAAAPQITFNLTLKDQTRAITIPVELESSERQLHVRGEFEIKQSDFGIKPFSVAMGAMQVQDAVKIKFDLKAERM